MNRVVSMQLAWVLTVVVAAAACGEESDTPPAQACVPGASVACACPSGVAGAQTCVANGSGYGACVCGGGAGGAGGTGNPPPAGGTGGSVTPPPPQPTNHVLANDQPGTINSDQYLDVPFRIDVASAKVSYQVADRSSSSPDNLTTAIVSDAEYRFLQNGQQYKAFGLKMGMAPLSGEAVVPGGGYHFVIVCTNLVQRCQFSFTLAALY